MGGPPARARRARRRARRDLRRHAEQIRAGRAKHGARATLLADPELAVTAKYGLVNRKGLTPGGLRRLPIPTTILVDADGVVRWIDQAADYQVRAHPSRVLEAIRRTLG